MPYVVGMALPAVTDDPWVPADSFGSRLALVRNHLGWNVKEAADACGLNDQSWRNWEAGKLPRDLIATAEKIASTTNCSMMWLVGGHQNWKKLMAPDLHVVQGTGSGPVSRGNGARFQQPALPMLSLVKS